VQIKCIEKASVYNNQIAMQTNVVVVREENYTRVSGKNLSKDIKKFICPFAGNEESSKLRKRIIALQKIQGSVSNKQLVFPIY